MAALFPMLLLASRATVACAAAAAFLSQGQAERGSAGGALREDHAKRAFGYSRASLGSVNKQDKL